MCRMRQSTATCSAFNLPSRVGRSTPLYASKGTCALLFPFPSQRCSRTTWRYSISFGTHVPSDVRLSIARKPASQRDPTAAAQTKTRAKRLDFKNKPATAKPSLLPPSALSGPAVPYHASYVPPFCFFATTGDRAGVLLLSLHFTFFFSFVSPVLPGWPLPPS